LVKVDGSYWQRNARSKASNWWRIMVIRVIIAKVIDKKNKHMGEACASDTKKPCAYGKH
jgi:hypothetical protein